MKLDLTKEELERLHSALETAIEGAEDAFELEDAALLKQIQEKLFTAET